MYFSFDDGRRPGAFRTSTPNQSPPISQSSQSCLQFEQKWYIGKMLGLSRTSRVSKTRTFLVLWFRNWFLERVVGLVFGRRKRDNFSPVVSMIGTERSYSKGKLVWHYVVGLHEICAFPCMVLLWPVPPKLNLYPDVMTDSLISCVFAVVSPGVLFWAYRSFVIPAEWQATAQCAVHTWLALFRVTPGCARDASFPTRVVNRLLFWRVYE